MPRKQRHTAKRVFDRLRDGCGFTGGYTIIKDYMREREQRRQEVFVPLSHPPGHAQADFGEAMVVIGGVERKAHFFVLDLPHSDGCYVRAYPAAVSEAWVDGHMSMPSPSSAACRSRSSTTTTDAWWRRSCPDGTRKRATLFSGFQSHYLIRDRYGRPGKGNDKGSVEGLVGYARRNFMVPIPRFATWEAFNAWLEAQCRKRQRDRLRGESERSENGCSGIWLPCVPCRVAFDACDQASGQGNGAVACTLQDQRLFGPGRLGPSGCLGPGICRRGGDRLPRRDHRPSSAELGT
jgi:transposase